MLDVKLIRENPEFVKANLAKRGNPEVLQMLEELITVDREWRLNNTKLNEMRHDRKLSHHRNRATQKSRQRSY